MDANGGLGMRNWGYYDQPIKVNPGLQLMSSVAEHEKKQLFSNGGFLQRDYSAPETFAPIEFLKNSWPNYREAKMPQMMPTNPSYDLLPNANGAHSFQIMQAPSPPKDDNVAPVTEPQATNDKPPKKRSRARPESASKPRKPKKAPVPKEERKVNSNPRVRNGRKSADIVINGIDLDLSGLPTPVCSCTGAPQQCYRWGVGGWQSACCTTSISVYPLPMSTKRRGSRIAGRKMSQGAFRKVLEKLAGEGYNLSNPIDLRAFWAKHGTNKFVTIR